MSSSTQATSAALKAARRQFFDEGAPLGDAGVPRVIGQSWQRCQGLDGGRLPGPEPLARAAFALRRESSRRLIDSAQPEIEALAEQMAHTRSVLILTDAQGLILEEAGSSDFLRRAERVALQPGVDWSEAQCGTNAIGTALVERQALEVRGAEHYLDAHRILSCAAAPILSSRGEVLGVLDVSGNASELHLHALALVKLASEQIEHRLIHAGAQGRRLLRFHGKAPMLGTPREAVLLIEDDRIVGANPIALRMLGLGWDAVLDQPLDLLFDSRWRSLGGAHGSVLTSAGLRFAAALQSPAPPSARAGSVRRETPSALAIEYPSDDLLAPLLAKAVRVLDAGSSVLLQGETGVGKDVFAGMLHRRSTRAGGPFVALNCAALPETLVEAELFGYAEGAFTGAQRRGQAGRVREADGGVLFLDEIGDMPLLLQSRLLRVLQERCVTPLGGARSVPVDFALVCATHRDLQAMVDAGSFRADLFYRLQDYTVTLPSLRERDDVAALVERVFGLTAPPALGLTLTSAAVAELASRRWPGNLRQLTSVLRTVVALADAGDVIDVAQLPPAPAVRADAGEQGAAAAAAALTSGASAGAPPAATAGASSAVPVGAGAAPVGAGATPVGAGAASVGAGAAPVGADSAAPAAAWPAAACGEADGVKGLRELTAGAIDAALAASGGRVGEAARTLGVNRSTVYRHLSRR